jgi:hypothetical protein
MDIDDTQATIKTIEKCSRVVQNVRQTQSETIQLVQK